MTERNSNRAPQNKSKTPKLKLVAEFELSPNDLTPNDIRRYTSMLNMSWVALAKDRDMSLNAVPLSAMVEQDEEDAHEAA